MMKANMLPYMILVLKAPDVLVLKNIINLLLTF